VNELIFNSTTIKSTFDSKTRKSSNSSVEREREEKHDVDESGLLYRDVNKSDPSNIVAAVKRG
jgi:hypothetical protein